MSAVTLPLGQPDPLDRFAWMRLGADPGEAPLRFGEHPTQTMPAVPGPGRDGS